MQLYRMSSAVRARGDLVDIHDPNERLLNYFVMDVGADEFERLLRFGPGITARAQENYTPRMLRTTDYLDTNLPIPMISPRLMSLIAEQTDQVQGYPCEVACRGERFPFVLCRIVERRDFVASTVRSWRDLSPGGPELNEAIDDGFLIARDQEHPMIYASQRFVDMCKAQRMRIDFRAVNV